MNSRTRNRKKVNHGRQPKTPEKPITKRQTEEQQPINTTKRPQAYHPPPSHSCIPACTSSLPTKTTKQTTKKRQVRKCTPKSITAADLGSDIFPLRSRCRGCSAWGTARRLGCQSSGSRRRWVLGSSGWQGRGGSGRSARSWRAYSRTFWKLRGAVERLGVYGAEGRSSGRCLGLWARRRVTRGA